MPATDDVLFAVLERRPLAQWNPAWIGLSRVLLGPHAPRFCRWRDEFSLYGHSDSDHDVRKTASIGPVSDEAIGRNPCDLFDLDDADQMVEKCLV